MQDEELLVRFSEEIAEYIEKDPDLNLFFLKKRLSKKYGLNGTLQNAAILSRLKEGKKTPSVLDKLRSRPTRTGSGVTPIALMPKPYPCPGQCIYCPQGDNAPKSYTGFEPATMRAIQNDYDAKRQIHMRIDQYQALGQPTDKCELIIMGGTFLSIPKEYADSFVHQCFDALNGSTTKTLIEAQKSNETARHRAVGLTIETRPDWCKKNHIDRMLEWGTTRVELGVQTLDEEVLKKVKRGHDVKETIRATKDLKDSALKFAYHMMPGLYSDHESDVRMLRQIFEDPDFCPDMLKVYPCLVIEGTILYDEFKKGDFKPISNEEAVQRVADAAEHFPPWVRIMRMQRDIPAKKISAGVTSGNLFQLVDQELERRGKKLRDIRSREIFSMHRKDKRIDDLNLEFVQRTYRASKGIEHFLSFEDIEKDLLAGFIRLRLPADSHREEITDTSALIRELHVYGSELALGNDPNTSSAQHKGLGSKLLERAEQIAVENGKDNMVIISGVGTREYYKKFNYIHTGPFMAKKIQ